MFNNPGGKIKSWAIAAFAIEAISAFISGIVYSDELEGLTIVVILGGILVAYTTALLLYALGELVENSSRSIELLERAEQREIEKRASAPKAPARKSAPVAAPTPNTAKPAEVVPKTIWAKPQLDENMIACPTCGTVQRKTRTTCFHCGAELHS